LQGYRQALNKAGLPFDPDIVRYGDFTPESGYKQMTSLLDAHTDITAVFVASDTVALGAKAAIQGRDLDIPGDIAMVGFDDLPSAQFTEPPLTTVHLPAIELARQASEMLIRVLEGDKSDCEHVLLDTDLVVRQSCGASSNGNSLGKINERR
jgi:LacI family transcriptional regulator